MPFYGTTRPDRVGSKPSDVSRWEQKDRVGNVGEMVLDAWCDPYLTGNCGDCTSLTPTTFRVRRGG